MAYRTYYDTQIKVYHLLNEHPIMNKMLTEFDIDVDNVKDVALYLLENHDMISTTPLNDLYYTSEILETIGELYGFFTPFDNQVSSIGTPLYELLNFTLYLYKFGTTENFYEKHILDFLPEYDREQIQDEPKLKLLYETIGRKMDDLELKISKMKDIYNIDDIPEDLLDYLGQNIGYEKEDYTLENVSFRELLKNIIEIYKIKGTNYSFSFFFKFLGFEITLKEFFFNHDVKNPEGFPGVENNKVEYYLTTKNPILDISNNKPAPFLNKTKNINNWSLELSSLEEAGCTNSIQYMLGFEPYNNVLDNPIWHSDPWTYFKTNLIEYELDPFFDKLNLTANDNETIRKYVKFLSPTYLFTWINVNLAAWIEDINIIQDTKDDWNISIINNLGDPRPSPTPWEGYRKTNQDEGFNGFNNDGIYYDYEPLDEILTIYKGGETLNFHIENNMNLGGIENIGTTLKRDGIYIRQPGHPKFISNITHEGDKKVSFDFMEIEIQDFINNNFVTQVNYYENLPETSNIDDIYYVKFSSNNPYGYYKYNSENEWEYISSDDYSYRSFPATPINPTPDNNQTISKSNVLSFIWEEIKGATGYWLQVAKDSSFQNIVLDIDYLKDNQYNTKTALEQIQILQVTKDEQDYDFSLQLEDDGVITSSDFNLNYFPHDSKFSNNKYYWRVKVKNGSTFPGLPQDNPLNLEKAIWSPWSNHWQFTLNAYPFPFNGEIIKEPSIYITKNIDEGLAFTSASFNIIWDDISGSEKYQIQILKNKPYVWSINNDFNFTDTFINLPIDNTLGSICYVVDEQKFYKFISLNQDWVSVPEQSVYSTIDKFEDLPDHEQKIGDTWFVIENSSYYRWQSVENGWTEITEMYNVLGNITNYDNLQYTNEALYSIYFVQSTNNFYQYIPIEETTQSIVTVYDEETKDNMFNVSLDNGLYYWRIRSFDETQVWMDWSNLYQFTIDFA